MPGHLLYAAAYLASAVGAAVFAALLWRRRDRATVVGALIVYLTANSVWSAGALFGAVGGPDAQRVTTQIIMAPVAVTVAACLCLCWAMADRAWRPTRRTLVLLAIHPAVMVVAGLTDVWHHGIVRPTADGTLEYGPFFWVHTAYSYGLIAVGVVHVLRERRNVPALQSKQLTTLVAAAFLPLVGNVITLVAIGPQGRDLTPVFFMLTALVVGYAVFHQGLIDIVPVARTRVLESVGDAIVVLDELDRVADANTAALGLLARSGSAPGPVVGRPAQDVLGPLTAALLAGDGEHQLVLGQDTVVLDVRTTMIPGRRGRPLGRVVVVRDVTEEHHRQVLLAEANETLTAQVETIERLRAEVAEQALRDTVTGLHNRRYLDTVLEQAVEEAVRTEVPLSVAFVDADHFKTINDVHGHAAGDRMLAAIAGALAAEVGPGDSLVRYGGEEFVLLLPAADPATALARAERLRAVCAAASIDVRGGAVTITVSVGIATTGPGVDTPDAVLEAADAALYEAKRLGRNRACAAPVAAPGTGTSGAAASETAVPAPSTS